MQLGIPKGGVLSLKPIPRSLAAVTLDREFASQQRQHDRAVRGRPGAIDNGNVARKQPDTGHAVACNAHRERRGLIPDQQFVEIKRTVQIVIRWRGKAARRRRCHQRHRHGLPSGDFEKGIDIPCPKRPARHALRQRRQRHGKTHHPGRFARRPPHSPRRCRHDALPTFCYRKYRRREAAWQWL
jgi:hypothetical protein